MKTLFASLALGATLLIANAAVAHIALLEPAARYNGAVGTQNKACPCGVGQGGTTCSSDSSDDFRSPRVTTLQPGETVTIRWDEYTGHSGRYRVAFDPDGADLDDFNANILADIEDPQGGDGNIGDGSIWEVEVTVPDTPCNNCTLQLIQVMDGNTADPVADPAGRSTYYQCADIVIAGLAADAGGPDPGLDVGGTGPGPADMGATIPAPDTGSSMGADTGSASGDDDGGGCAVVGSAPIAPFAALCVVFALRLRRRRC